MSASCPNTRLVPAGDNLPEIRTATLCLINDYRAAHGVRALRWSGILERASQPYAQMMIKDDFFSHFAPNGSSPLLRILRAGYLAFTSSYRYGENIAWGAGDVATPRSIVDRWVTSAIHRTNILSRSFRDTAIGVVAATPAILGVGSAGAVYVEDFGSTSG